MEKPVWKHGFPNPNPRLGQQINKEIDLDLGIWNQWETEQLGSAKKNSTSQIFDTLTGTSGLSLIFVSLSFEFQSLYFYAFQFSDSFSILIYISFSAIIFSDSNSMQLSAYSDCCYFGGYLQDFVKDIEFSSLIFGVVSFFLGFCVFVLVLHWIIWIGFLYFCLFHGMCYVLELTLSLRGCWIFSTWSPNIT